MEGGPDPRIWPKTVLVGSPVRNTPSEHMLSTSDGTFRGLGFCFVASFRVVYCGVVLGGPNVPDLICLCWKIAEGAHRVLHLYLVPAQFIRLLHCVYMPVVCKFTRSFFLRFFFRPCTCGVQVQTSEADGMPCGFTDLGWENKDASVCCTYKYSVTVQCYC